MPTPEPGAVGVAVYDRRLYVAATYGRRREASEPRTILALFIGAPSRLWESIVGSLIQATVGRGCGTSRRWRRRQH